MEATAGVAAPAEPLNPLMHRLVVNNRGRAMVKLMLLPPTLNMVMRRMPIAQTRTLPLNTATTWTSATITTATTASTTTKNLSHRHRRSFSLLHRYSINHRRHRRSFSRLQELVGSLMGLSTQTRPDISNAVRAVGRYCAAPKRVHWRAALGILGYVRRTSSFGITFQRGWVEGLNLQAFADADCH